MKNYTYNKIKIDLINFTSYLFTCIVSTNMVLRTIGIYQRLTITPGLKAFSKPCSSDRFIKICQNEYSRYTSSSAIFPSYVRLIVAKMSCSSQAVSYQQLLMLRKRDSTNKTSRKFTISPSNSAILDTQRLNFELFIIIQLNLNLYILYIHYFLSCRILNEQINK